MSTPKRGARSAERLTGPPSLSLKQVRELYAYVPKQYREKAHWWLIAAITNDLLSKVEEP